MDETIVSLRQQDKITDEEYYSYWYFRELQKEGFIERIVHQPEIKLFPSISFEVNRFGKNGQPVKSGSKCIFREETYTPDFAIYWTEKAVNLFAYEKDHIIEGYIFHARRTQKGLLSLFDAKGTYSVPGQNNMHSASTFPIKSKIVYHLYGHVVNKFVPFDIKDRGKIKEGMFTKTFTPNAYAFRSKVKGKGYLKCYCTVKTLKEYLNERYHLEALSNR